MSSTVGHNSMSAIINIENVYASLPYAREATRTGTQRQAALGTDGDTAEFSSLSRALAQGVDQSSLRIARTRAIRAAIENGTYETPERINGTARRLLDVIG